MAELTATSRRKILGTTGVALAASGAGALAGCLGGGSENAMSPMDLEEIPPSDYPADITKWGFYNEWYNATHPQIEENTDLSISTNVTTSGSEQIGVLETGNQEQLDTMGAVSYVVTRGLQEGNDWFYPLPIDQMESWNTMPDTHKEIAKNHYTVDGDTYAVLGNYDLNPTLHYNSDYFDEPPSSWSVLWDEDLRGDVALFDNATWAGYVGAMHTGQSPTDPDDFDDIEEALMQQQDLNATYWGDYSQGQSMMSREEIVVTANTAGRAFRARFNDGSEHVDYTIPEEGAMLSDLPSVIPKGASNTKGAMVYLENFLTPEGNFGLFEGHGQTPAIKTETFNQIAEENEVPQEQIEFVDHENKNPHDGPLHSVVELGQDVRSEYADIWTRVRGA